VDLIARSFATYDFDPPEYELKTNMKIVFLLCTKPGVVSNRAPLEPVKDLQSHFFSKINIKQGDKLHPTKDLFGSLEMGFVALSHVDPEIIQADYRAIRGLEASLFK